MKFTIPRPQLLRRGAHDFSHWGEWHFIVKKNGRIRSRKRYGKTVMNRAPALLIRILERKLGYLCLAINKVDTFRVNASQYDHKSDIYIKKPLSERWHTFQDGTKMQRDLYSSFLICYTNSTFDQVDREACKRNYQTFKQLHDEEIARLRKADGITLRWYNRLLKFPRNASVILVRPE